MTSVYLLLCIGKSNAVVQATFVRQHIVWVVDFHLCCIAVSGASGLMRISHELIAPFDQMHPGIVWSSHLVYLHETEAEKSKDSSLLYTQDECHFS